MPRFADEFGGDGAEIMDYTRVEGTVLLDDDGWFEIFERPKKLTRRALRELNWCVWVAWLQGLMEALRETKDETVSDLEEED